MSYLVVVSGAVVVVTIVELGSEAAVKTTSVKSGKMDEEVDVAGGAVTFGGVTVFIR